MEDKNLIPFKGLIIFPVSLNAYTLNFLLFFYIVLIKVPLNQAHIQYFL